MKLNAIRPVRMSYDMRYCRSRRPFTGSIHGKTHISAFRVLLLSCIKAKMYTSTFGSWRHLRSSNFSHTAHYSLFIIHAGSIVFFDPKNLGVAVGITLLYFIRNDVYGLAYRLPINGDHLWFATHSGKAPLPIVPGSEKSGIVIGISLLTRRWTMSCACFRFLTFGFIEQCSHQYYWVPVGVICGSLN